MLFMYCVCHALFIVALWSGKGLTLWPLFMVFNCVFVTFPCGIIGQVWNMIVSIVDLCSLSYYVNFSPLGQSSYLGVESNDYILSNCFESVWICDGSPLTTGRFSLTF